MLLHFSDCIDGDFHLLHIIKAVEDTVHIHACFSRCSYKLFYDVIRIRFVTNAISTSKKHLGTDVRDCFSQLSQASKCIFLKKAVCYIKCSAAPAFQREKRML